MTAPHPHPAHVQRLAQECAYLAHRTSQIAAELAALQAAPVSAPAPVPTPPLASHPRPPVPPRRSWLSRAADDGRLVGTVLAVAGVAVTVVGVGLLLVLVAQAGLLRPEVRVAAGAAFAACTAALAVRARTRGADVGAVALAATGIATAYLVVVAVTSLYHWVPTVVGLVLAAAVAGAGVGWARTWRSERLAIVTVTPLIAVAPLVAGGVDLALAGFMVGIAVTCVAVAHRTPWAWLPVVAVTGAALWVTAGVVAARLAAVDVDGPLLAAACVTTAMTGLSAGFSSVTRRVSATSAALSSVIGCVPALVCGLAVQRPVAAAVVAAVAVASTALVVRASAGTSTVRTTWACLAASASVIAIPTAFDAPVAVPALLALAATVTVAGRGDRVIAGVGTGLAAIGTLAHLGWSVPVESLLTPIARTDGQTVSAVVASLLLIGVAAAVGVVHRARPGAPIAAGVVALYGLTATVVTVGVAVGGPDAGFLAGHMAATVAWVVAASVVLALAARMPAGPGRRAPIAAAVTLAGAAVAKLVTFDLATLDGAFRVGAFVAAGLVLLAVGARQARARVV
ncbi:MAG: DUF2339 domain-containing protein [Gordonia paraffinivorans]